MKLSEIGQAAVSITASGHAVLTVVCLCAAWCGVCRQYEPEFQALQLQCPDIRFVWMDVEEHEDSLGDLDIETFPTLFIGVQDQPLFLGPLLPQIKVLERLLQALQVEPKATASLPAEAKAVWTCLMAQ